MLVNHYHLEAAIAHLSKQIQSSRPDKHYVLFKATLGNDRLSWHLWAGRPYDELCEEMGVVFFETFPAPEPYIVEFHELEKQQTGSMKDIYVDVEGLELALVTAQESIVSSQKFSDIVLFGVLNLWDSQRKVWQLDYFAKNANALGVHIQIKVDVDSVVIIYLQIID